MDAEDTFSGVGGGGGALRGCILLWVSWESPGVNSNRVGLCHGLLGEYLLDVLWDLHSAMVFPYSYCFLFYIMGGLGVLSHGAVFEFFSFISFISPLWTEENDL